MPSHCPPSGFCFSPPCASPRDHPSHTITTQMQRDNDLKLLNLALQREAEQEKAEQDLKVIITTVSTAAAVVVVNISFVTANIVANRPRLSLSKKHRSHTHTHRYPHCSSHISCIAAAPILERMSSAATSTVPLLRHLSSHASSFLVLLSPSPSLLLPSLAFFALQKSSPLHLLNSSPLLHLCTPAPKKSDVKKMRAPTPTPLHLCKAKLPPHSPLQRYRPPSSLCTRPKQHDFKTM